MAVEITMPQLSDTMSEGKILTWLKHEGDAVSRGDALAEVATDKADLEIESFHEGVLLKIFAPEGETVRVGSVIAIVGAKGEHVGEQATKTSASTPAAPATKDAPQIKEPAVASSPSVVVPSAVAQIAAAPKPSVAIAKGTPELHVIQKEVVPQESERVKISPLAKNLAKNHGVEYAALQGSGEGGRIVKRDIEKFTGQAILADPFAKTAAPVSQPALSTAPSAVFGSTEQLSRMRQTIAERMVQATTTIPHFYCTTKIEADELVKLRTTLKPLPQYEGLTFNHLIIRAAALALRVVPRINATFKDNYLVQPGAINIGIVTAVSDGLLIPVVKNADRLALAGIVEISRALVHRARGGRPKPDDLVGGTFSISNMGMFAVESFTAIINPGQGAILAVSAINDEPVARDGAVKVGKVMRLTLSVDHRIIDGIVAGEYLTEIKRLLEEPVLLLA